MSFLPISNSNSNGNSDSCTGPPSDNVGNALQAAISAFSSLVSLSSSGPSCGPDAATAATAASANSPPSSWSTMPPPSSPAGLASFSLTHVQYERADVLGRPLALASLAPIFLVVAYTTLAVSSRDLATLWMFAGQLANEGLNAVIKVWIGQPRPTAFLGRGHGMPSSHAQFMWFFAVYLGLYTAYRLQFKYGLLWKPLIVAGLTTFAAVVSYSRVHLFYHTAEQVVAGSLLGSLTGAGWFVAVDRLLFPLSERVRLADGPLGSLLLLRDTRAVGNLLRAQRDWALSAGHQSRKGSKGSHGSKPKTE
ncbi:hypothetical protein BC831DRAFT_447436 [Entophlyctis helioformis]|nr:hypothetical protein BC831DRAFT_447436 [Entophlyctis helioformis]